MEHSKSAAKRVRQDRRRRLESRSNKTYIKTRVKKFMVALEGGSLQAARTEYNRTAQALDRAARKKVIHPNLAARKKSRLARKLNVLEST